MLTKQILEKISRYAPDKASDLKEAVLMLIDILDEANQNLSLLSNNRLEGKEYQKSIDIIKLMEDLDKCRKQILDQVIDVETGQDEQVEVDLVDDDEKFLEIEKKEKIDYSLYTVDNAEVHDLYESYKFKRPIAFVWQGRKYYASNFKAILLEVANYLLEKHGDDFRNLSDNEMFIGRKNKMISVNPEDLLTPKLLKDKHTYLHTCLCSDSIVRLIRRFLEYFDYDINEFKIYLRADYNDLHTE